MLKRAGFSIILGLLLLLLSSLLILPTFAQGGGNNQKPPATLDGEGELDGQASSVQALKFVQQPGSYKDGPSVVEQGGQITYTLLIKNNDPFTATASLSDTLPAGVNYIPNSLSCAGGSGSCTYDSPNDTIHWNGDISAGAAVTLSFAVDTLPTACGTTIYNSASIAVGNNPITTINHPTSVWDNVIFYSNFENDDGGFSANTPPGEWAWGVISPTVESPLAANSGSRVWATNLTRTIPTEPSDHYLTKTLSLPAMVDGHLNWWDWWAEDGADVGRVFIDGTEVYNISDDQLEWQNHSLDLSPWSEQNVDIVFYYEARTNDEGGAGWYLDDVAVVSCDINLKKQAPANVAAQNSFTYTISAQHVFSSTLNGVSITDPLPAGTSYIANSATNGASYNSAQNQIEWNGSINPSETLTITFAVTATAGGGELLNNTALLSYTGQNTNTALSTAHSRIFEATATPFCEGFESGLLPTFMFTETTINTSSYGRARVSNQFPYSGQYAFDLDSSQNIEHQKTSQAGIIAINLAGQSDVELDFWLMGHGDESDPEDGIFISDDNGLSYSKIYTLPVGRFNYQNIQFDLASAAAGAGLNLSDNFYIKFQSYDDFTTTDDGYSFDDICIGPATGNLSVSKLDAPDPVQLGQPLTYTILVASNGLADALNAVLTDTLPLNVSLGSVNTSHGSCAGTAPLVCNLGDITTGATATITIAVTPTQQGIVSNTVWASISNELETNTADNSATAYTTILANNLPALYGTVFQGSDGPADLYRLDPLSGEMNLIGSTGFERVGAIDVNRATGLLYATAERNDGSDTGVLILLDPTTGAGTEVGPTGLPGNISDISFRNSDSVLYAYSAENHELYTLSLADGSATLVGNTNPVSFLSGNGMAFSVNDTLYHATDESLNSLNQQTGAGSVLYPLSFSPTFTDDTRLSALDFLTDTNTLFGTIKHGYGGVLSSYLSIVELETGTVNNITPTLSGLDGIAFGPAISLTNVADLNISKMGYPNSLNAGESLTYTLIISNSGPASSTNVIVVDYLPSSVSVDAVSGPGCISGSNLITCTVGTLAGGSGNVITINATSAISALGIITNTANISGSGVDPTLANNTALHTATVIAPRLAVMPAELTSLQEPDSIMSQTLSLSNSGNTTTTWTLTDLDSVPWLGISPLSGNIAPQNQIDVSITFDSAGLLTGTYTTTLVANSNAPLNGVITLPVSLSVQSVAQGLRWDKQVWLNGLLIDSNGTIIVTSTDTVEIVDRVWITDTQSNAFTLTEAFDALLNLNQTEASIGSIISATGIISWQVASAPGNSWHVLTKTFSISPTGPTTAYVTETLSVANLPPENRLLQFSLGGSVMAPQINVAPTAISVTLLSDTTLSQTLNLTNSGTASLTWALSVSPTVAWLAANPASGLILAPPAQNAQAVTLDFDSTGLSAGTYTTSLKISSNDPANSLLSLPASLTVEGCQAISGLDFAYIPTNPSAGQSISFSGSVVSGNFVTYQWDFGDGNTASGQSVNHAFDGALVPLSYTVALTASNPCSGPLSVNKTITVEPAKIYLPLLLKNYCFSFNYVGTLQYNMSIINAPQAWNVATTCLPGSGVVVAIVDSGVDLDHPDLQANLVGGATFVPGTLSPDDDEGHGTHVAGIVGAVGNDNRPVGLAPRASIMPIKVLDSNGSGYHSWVAAGIIWAVDNGAKVINLSLGGVNASSTLFDAVNYAFNNGVLVIASGGNCGSSSYWLNGCSYQNQPNYPAAYGNVMAVASTDSNDERSSFSNENYYIEISAPGSEIYSTIPGGGIDDKNGTSQAAPHVAGLAALIWAETPALSRDQVRAHIWDTAVDLGDPGRDNSFGEGRIDAATALGVTAVQAGPPPAPASPPKVDSTSDYASGRILLKIDEGTTLSEVLNTSGKKVSEIQALTEINALGTYVVSVPVGEEELLANELAQVPGVVYAEPDYKVQAQ